MECCRRDLQTGGLEKLLCPPSLGGGKVQGSSRAFTGSSWQGAHWPRSLHTWPLSVPLPRLPDTVGGHFLCPPFLCAFHEWVFRRSTETACKWSVQIRGWPLPGRAGWKHLAPISCCGCVMQSGKGVLRAAATAAPL